MKTNHNQLRIALFAVTVLGLLARAIARADNFYVSCSHNGTIKKLQFEQERDCLRLGFGLPVLYRNAGALNPRRSCFSA